ncbi:MAG: glycosyltransferase family 39 protein [Anaerolineae bacterium]|nr:glycosyltransferase family 39 protein [Anaerolineae bacterium]
MTRSTLSGRKFTALYAVFLFVLALVYRLSPIGRYVTPDETAWLHRSILWRAALLDSGVVALPQVGHPGVTTTWLGALAVQIKLWLTPASAADVAWARELIWLTPDYGEAFQRLFPLLQFGRITIAVVTSLGVVAIFLLARRKLGVMAAVIGGFMLALDPFAAGLSGLLHTDALLATFAVITILLVVPAQWDALPSRRAMLLCGVFTALAVLSKLPGATLLLFVPLCLLITALIGLRSRLWQSQARVVIGRGALWLAAAAVTAILLLPALIFAPGELRAVIERSTSLEVALVSQTFFFGRNTPNPGLLFYPVAAAFRISPATTIGLALLVILSVGNWMRDKIAPRPFVIFAPLFIVLFTISLSVSERVFDRYMLPNLLLLILLAALGWALIIAPRSLCRQRLLLAAVALLTVAFAVVNWHYPLYAANWLAGGRQTAAKTIPTGWGETASAAARWAGEQTGAANATLFTADVPSAAPFFPGETIRLDEMRVGEIEPNDFVMLPDDEGDFSSPVHLVTIGGDRMAVYTGMMPDHIEASPLQLQPLSKRFDTLAQLEWAGWRLAEAGDKVTVRAGWIPLQSADGVVQISLVGPDGAHRVRVEQPLANRAGLPSRAWSEGELQSAEYTLHLPPDLPPAAYDLTMTLFDSDGALQGVFRADGSFEDTFVRLDTLFLPAPEPR